jgi:hypothetical protein
MPAVLAPLIPAIVQALGALVIAGIGWLTLTVKTSISNDNAWKQVAELGASVIGTAWDTIGPQLQAALADGSISAAERAAIEAAVFQTIQKSATQPNFEVLAKKLNIPLAAIVAKLASSFVQTWAAAHDPAVTTASALAFPVAAVAQSNLAPNTDAAYRVSGG